jgi:hypothetical protein
MGGTDVKTNTDPRGAIRPALDASLKSAELLAKSAAEQKQLLAKMRQNAARLSGAISLLKARVARDEKLSPATRRFRPHYRTGIFQ